jgi:hypothetical protein
MTKIAWFINLLFSVVALIFLFYSTVANTARPIFGEQQTGKYLGNLSSNPYGPNSTSNPYGQYGPKHLPDSINNSYGQYDSEHSNGSVNNPYATNPPATRF